MLQKIIMRCQAMAKTTEFLILNKQITLGNVGVHSQSHLNVKLKQHNLTTKLAIQRP